MGSFRAECKCSERVHDDIDPENLNDGKGLRVSEQRCEEYQETGTEVYRELEEHKSLDILIE